MPRDDLIVVANRLPVHQVERDGEFQWETSPGGLVSALQSVLVDRGVTWVGWTGSEGKPPEPFEHSGIHHHAIALTDGEIENYYRNFSNRTIWPLYHDCVRTPEYHRHWWRPYRTVNERFADAVAEVLPEGGTVWVHDYHLQLVPGMLRERRPDATISFFLHIPFPPMELFAQIPWRRAIVEGMLGADLLGFQTRDGAQNFSRLARRLTDAEGVEGVLIYRDRRVSVQGIPISIDRGRFERLAADPVVRSEAQRLRKQMRGRRVFLGVDRLDYTKGIDIRLRALETLFERRPELAHETAFIQVAVPSRKYVPEYKDMRTRIEQVVGRINGEYSEPGTVPVHYLYRNLPLETLVSYYLAADVMVVTPFRDGMNLVAKEYVACRREEDGVLVLSEFTGAASELTDAVLVNPHDIDGLAGALEKAIDMEPGERGRRMGALRGVLRENDVFDWAKRCLMLLVNE